MRNSQYLILLILLVGCSIYPSRTVPTGFISESNIRSKPFQVVYAKQTRKIGDTAELVALEYLFLEDIIRLEKSGYLILAHYSGLFLEFENDTIFSISEISEKTSQQLNINSQEVKHRTDIELLYTDERKHQYYPGVVSRCISYPMALISPARTTSEISAKSPKICISWESNLNYEPESYEVQIKNIFDENLDIL